MAQENKYEKLKKAIGGFQESSWVEDNQKFLKELPWREKSQLVAIRILRTLREKNMSQAALAEKLSVSPQQVSKWVKGSENFTLETISKIEDALALKLIGVVQSPDSSSESQSHGHSLIWKADVEGSVLRYTLKKKLKASRPETDLYQELPDTLYMAAEPTAEYLSTSKAGLASSSKDFFLSTVTIHRFDVQETGHPMQKVLDVNIMIEYEAMKEQHGISCTVNYTLSSTNMHLLDCRVTCLYTIDKADWDNMVNGDRLTIPAAFARHITILTSGITRGALESKIMDSAFRSYPMALINMDDLPDDDITIEL